MSANAKLKDRSSAETGERASRQVHLKERHLQLIEGKKKVPSDYFYQVSNPMELTKIGQSFLDDFKLGIKSFAISSTDYKSSQQRTVLAFACYFDHLFDMKILIISDSLHKGIFAEVMNETTIEMRSISNTEKEIEVNHFHHHFDLIDLHNLFKLNKIGKPNFDFEVTIQNLINSYDIVLWDTPTINVYKSSPQAYNQTLNYFESLTIIVSQTVSHSKDINELKDYFSSFGVNIKGVLFDKVQMEQELKKPKRWGIF